MRPTHLSRPPQWFRIHRKTLYGGIISLLSTSLFFGAAIATHEIRGIGASVPAYIFAIFLAAIGTIYILKQPPTTKE